MYSLLLHSWPLGVGEGVCQSGAPAPPLAFVCDVCVGHLYNFICIDMCRLEFSKEYQHRVKTFLINDSFIGSSCVCREMAGNMFVQSLPVKQLNVDTVISRP